MVRLQINQSMVAEFCYQKNNFLIFCCAATAVNSDKTNILTIIIKQLPEREMNIMMTIQNQYIAKNTVGEQKN